MNASNQLSPRRLIVLGLAIIGAVLIGIGLEPTPRTIGGGVLLIVFGYGLILWLANHPDFTLAKGSALLALLPRIDQQRAGNITAEFLEVLSGIAAQPGIFHASVVAPLAAIGFATEMLPAYAMLLHIIEMILMSALCAWGLSATRVTFGNIRALFGPAADSAQST